MKGGGNVLTITSIQYRTTDVLTNIYAENNERRNVLTITSIEQQMTGGGNVITIN